MKFSITNGALSFFLVVQNGGFVWNPFSRFRSTQPQIKEARMGKTSIGYGGLRLCSAFVFSGHWRWAQVFIFLLLFMFCLVKGFLK